MRIRHNISALNARTNKTNKDSKVQKQLQKLSTGYRINIAADDASGLAVSEKMRALSTGLGQALRNSEDGISLIQIGEGTLQEVHAMLNRVVELADESSNGIYQDEIDREGLQKELEHILSEIDRIAEDANFNGIRLFQDKGYPYETTKGAFDSRAFLAENGQRTLQDVLNNTPEGEFNIIYTETTEFVTTQTGSGVTTSAYDTTGIKDMLQQQIVPHAVTRMLAAYPAFSYLNGSSIGIGLDLYSDPSSTVMASVTSSTDRATWQSYKLSVNMGRVDTNAGREELERVIAHEMMHAFMFEADTKGMISNPKFPSWFVEGMAQTTCGPGNWVKTPAGLNLNSSSTSNDIKNTLADPRFSLGSGTTASEYGTGYLACMYLGFKAYGNSGGSGIVDAGNISKGLSDILKAITGGKSMDQAFQELTGYAGVADFQTKFPQDSAQFVHDLFTATGSGAGGVISGDLTASDLFADSPVSGINLFKLDTQHQTVKNIYPSDVNVNSGGSVSGAPGTPPVVDYNGPYPDGIFSVNGTSAAAGVPGTGYEYDTTGTLKITAAGTYKISGGHVTDSSGNVYVGRIELADNIAGTVELILDGVEIDRSGSARIAALNLGDGNKVELTIGDGKDNVFKSGDKCAGIQLGSGTDITIKDGGAGTGTLESYGGNGGAGIGVQAAIGGSVTGGDITVKSGRIKAVGGSGGGAGIGAGFGTSIGDITIENGDIYAEGLEHGAGIGGGWGNTSNGKITIIDGTITAKGTVHGTGIGAGCSGKSGEILIRGGTITAQGGDDGAGIGASWNGSCEDITIDSGAITASGGRQGAGIGAGSGGNCKKITINGGEINATGGTNGAGIGSGVQATGGDIALNGGVITALGGLTNGGGNIGNYTDRTHHDAAKILIGSGTTIKAGAAGEGLYNTSGATDDTDTPVYSYPLPLDSSSSKIIQSITSKGAVSGTTFSWPAGTRHIPEDTAYIWMYGEDQKVTVTYHDGTSDIFDLVFYPDAGVWRKRGEPAPPPAQRPNNPSDPTNPVVPGPPQDPEVPRRGGGIILQIGANYEDILEVPVFFFSVRALGAEHWSVATQQEAFQTLNSVGSAIDRVSSIRGTYGALQNTLEHNVASVDVTRENIIAAESRIRDADMAKEMMTYVTNQVLTETAQAMLAQANTAPRSVMQLLQ